LTQYNEAAFDPKAARYEEKWEDYLTHTHGIFLDKIDSSDSDTLLDASSGTGLLAGEIIKRGMPFRELFLNDPSQAMLDFARKRLEGHPDITFTNYTVEKMPFGEHTFDGVICLNAFHFYTGQEKVLKNFKRILKSGGRLYILDWNRSGFFRLINRIIKWSTTENINTRSLVETHDILKDSGFHISEQLDWNWRYWKFYFIEARK